MIASSFSRGSIELLKRTNSPTFCTRSAISGLRSSALNGPRCQLPRGPEAMPCATRFWSGVIVASDSGAKRSVMDLSPQ